MKWETRALGHLVTKIGSGNTPDGGQAAYLASGVPLIRSQNVHMNRFEPKGLAFISEEQDRRMSGSRVEVSDVLLNITGASIGRVCVAPADRCPANVNQHVSIIRCGDSLDAHYLAFHLSSPVIQDLIWNSQAGATRQALTKKQIEEFKVLLPPLPEQKRIAARLREQLAEVEKARHALQSQLEGLDTLADAFIARALGDSTTRMLRIEECLSEVTKGIGEKWAGFPVLGATRAGAAAAKEPVGKTPQRYKPIVPGTIFYNPMRILLGSIAMLNEGEMPGITSPDYVVMRTKPDVMNPVWFYRWFRSHFGAAFIKSLSRGAVRERLMFARLREALIPVPLLHVQDQFAAIVAEASTAQRALNEQIEAIEKLPAGLLREMFAPALNE